MKMNFLLVVSIFVVFVSAAFGQTAASGDAVVAKDGSFSSKDGRFTVTLPAGFDAPVFSSSPNPTDAGNITINQYLQGLDRGTLLVAYYDFPQDLFQRKSIGQMLNDARDRIVKNMSATLQREVELTVDGYPGKSFYLQVPNKGSTIYVRGDFVVAQPRGYNVLFLALDEAELSKPDIKNYFGSFHIQK